MAADTATRDAAFELAATKLAFVQVLETLTGTSPIDTSVALDAWACEGPTLPENSGELMWRRVDEIEEQMLRAVGSFLIAKADGLAVSRG